MLSRSFGATQLLAATVINGALVLGAPWLTARDGTSPSLPFDPNTTKDCSWWVDVNSEYSCTALVADNFISLEDFRRWNPSITADCGGVVVGRSYCVEALNEPLPTSSPSSQSSSIPASTTSKPITPSSTSIKPTTSASSSSKPISTTPSSTLKTSSTTPPPTTTTPTNGVSTPSPLQPSIVPNCDAFYFVKEGENCETIAAAHGISTAQFIAWNPSAGSSCTGLWGKAYACVSIIGHTPTSSVPTTTKPTNGIATPSPIQTGMIGNCDSFYKVKSGDVCDKIAAANGISSAQIMSWNPAVGSTCAGLLPDYYICISTVGHTPTPTQKPTSTKPGNGIATPTPYQTGMTTSCKTFHFIAKGETCATIAAKYKISVDNFVKWNPASGGTSCGGLWAETYCCVGVL